MNGLLTYLKTSYTAYHAAENAARELKEAGFVPLAEQDLWQLTAGGKYFVRRGASIIAFVAGTRKGFSVVASHTDSPCLKLKENAALSDANFTRLNTEGYGGGLWYTFFDRPLKLAGRIVCEEDGRLVSKTYESAFNVVLPSLAIHMNRDANEKFSPDLQTELPLLSLGKKQFDEIVKGAVSYDLFAVPAEEPFFSGADGEFFSSPRIDDLSGVYASLTALKTAKGQKTLVAACLESEEIGSRTRAGAASDFLRSVLDRIQNALYPSDMVPSYASDSFLVSLDNAHSLHPNHPEKCDPTNRAVMGGGIVIKGHAGGAYTTDGMSSAVIKTVFGRAGVRYQTFFNRSDMRSGSTLGAVSLGQISVPSVDLGLAQLAMHSAVETMACSDYRELVRGLAAFYGADITFDCDTATVE